jgi:hypothetical protein
LRACLRASLPASSTASLPSSSVISSCTTITARARSRPPRGRGENFQNAQRPL